MSCPPSAPGLPVLSLTGPWGMMAPVGLPPPLSLPGTPTCLRGLGLPILTQFQPSGQTGPPNAELHPQVPFAPRASAQAGSLASPGTPAHGDLRLPLGPTSGTVFAARGCPLRPDNALLPSTLISAPDKPVTLQGSAHINHFLQEVFHNCSSWMDAPLLGRPLWLSAQQALTEPG